MKIEVKITDEAGNVQQYVVSGSLPSREDAKKEGKNALKVERVCCGNQVYL